LPGSLAGADQATLLIFRDYRSKDPRFGALDRHFYAPKCRYKALEISSGPRITFS
jgi:hypothetical protein